MKRLQKRLSQNKYEILLLALILHLYVGIVVTDLEFYARWIFLFNMIFLGVASVGIYTGEGRLKKLLKNTLLATVIAAPMSLPFFYANPVFTLLVSIVFCLFYSFILYEVLRFLIRPSYINLDIISGSLCGYFLLVEIMAFLMMGFYYTVPGSFQGINFTAISIDSAAEVFMDLVYFSTITITSIGFGDILPSNHHTKLITSFFGVAGQLYSVILVGVLISKFTSRGN